jgi:uracil-DNA glycosylase
MKDSEIKEKQLKMSQVLKALKENGINRLALYDEDRLKKFLSAVGSKQNPPVSASSLQETREIALQCTRCALSKGRTQVVFGSGPDQADLMFVGEAPGFEEDRQGLPFVGRAGQLLTRMIQAMGLKREEVYIANCLKCRPPGNRDPLLDEIASCRPYLDVQIERVNPKIICCLGRFAAQLLVGQLQSLGRLRGKFHTVRGRQVMCTYHPAYLLRNEADKRWAWEDLKQVRDSLKKLHAE